MSDDDDELAALREQTAHGDRLDTAADGAETAALVAAIRDELTAIEAGDKQKTVSVWDGHIAAFIHGLEDAPDHRQAVGHALQAELDREQTAVDRSELIRLALRVGFKQAAPEEFAALAEAVKAEAVNEL